MRVGFTTVYSWRPHVQQMYYLAKLLADSGIMIEYMTCSGDLPTCYTRQMRPNRSQLVECTLCKIGNIAKYSNTKSFKIRGGYGGDVEKPDGLALNKKDGYLDWGTSSASTIVRFESEAELEREPFLSLRSDFAAAAEMGYMSARRWIREKKLDAIFVFNGRIDVTRGICEAAKSLDVTFVSVERSWFGNGVQLLPNETCLGLQTVHACVQAWVDVPLTERQAYLGAKAIAERMLRKNSSEWRSYNVNGKAAMWPIAEGRWKVLILPGSRNELHGHPDWEEEWRERTDGYDALIERFRLQPHDVVLRAHPNWSEKIGSQTGEKSSASYRLWCEQRGIRFIPGDSDIDTFSLIKQSDLVVIHASSAALDAGMLGKRVVCMSGTIYKNADFLENARSKVELRKVKELQKSVSTLEKRLIISKTMRFCFTMTNRFAQLTEYIRSVNAGEYRYFDGASSGRIINIIKTGALQADDPVIAETAVGEERVIDLIDAEDWQTIVDMATFTKPGAELEISRRGVYRHVEKIRELFPNGDR